jgi:signal transduction histidine kinase
MPGRLAQLVLLPNLPWRTVRLRLTLLYGALFLVSGAALLTITYLLVSNSTGKMVLIQSRTAAPAELGLPSEPLDLPESFAPEGLEAEAADLREQAAAQREEQLDQLLIQSAIALGLMSVVSIGLGWLMAGRVLRPLRTMTSATRRISEHNLHERLALEGPRDELKDLGDTIDELLARLEAAFDAQRRFVANASHELRTPLAMMRTSLDVAAAKPGQAPPQLRTLDGKLREGLDRADHLLEDFLTLARAQHGALPERDTVSLSAIGRTALDSRGDAISRRGLEVHRQLDEVAVSGSETLLTHMVENVVENAIRHNEPSGWIRIETRAEGTVARLAVESGGRRLREEEVEALAQPFRRLGAERTGSENGVGLGLSIVAAIVAAHDGQLQLRAREQGGLRVNIELPLTTSTLPAGTAS